MTLGDYLAAAGRKAWRDGEHDCATFPAGWIMECGHPDPMERWRGAYTTADGAQAIIEGAGGLVAIWEEALDHLPSPEPESVEAGDVAVIAVFGEGGLTANGAIFTGKRWAFLAPRGLFCSSIDPEHVLKVWRP